MNWKLYAAFDVTTRECLCLLSQHARVVYTEFPIHFYDSEHNEIAVDRVTVDTEELSPGKGPNSNVCRPYLQFNRITRKMGWKPASPSVVKAIPLENPVIELGAVGP